MVEAAVAEVRVAETKRSGRRRELVAATVGSVVESYDWSVYGVLAPFFAAQIFPGHSEITRFLAAYAVFAVGFVFRPLGSWLVGRLADTRGRRFGLTLSVSGVALASLIVALVPTQEQIGAGAAVIVVFARLLQGITMGGENPTAAAYVTETAPRARRFLYSAISYGGVILGSLLCFGVLSVTLAVLGPDGVKHGGWRIGFAVGALLGLAALWIRRTAPESESFEREVAARAEKPRALPVLRAHLRQCVAVFCVSIGGTIAFYFGTVYLPVYAAHVHATTVAGASMQIELGLAALMFAMAGGGMLADRLGSLRTIRIGYLILAVATVPLMLALRAHLLPFAAVALLYLLCLAIPLAMVNVFAGQLFPTEVRAVAIGVPSALAIGLFGGTFPLVAQALTAAGHLQWVPWIAAGAACVSVVASFLVRPADTAKY